MQNKNKKRHINVLWVDNDKSLLCISKKCLEIQGGLNIETATSSDEALAKIENDTIKPDVIVCGLPISTSDCLDFLKILRHNGNTTPFIVFSMDVEKELIIRALELGANGFIGRYGDPEVIYQNLKKRIEDLTNGSL
jgi:DNA-binding NarL/FixJ family response regulator